MEEAEIVRVTNDDSKPQMGVFLHYGLPQFLTLEESYTGEEKCIPLGKYTARKTYGRKTKSLIIKVTFEVIVPSRKGILFHVGNTAKDTSGCILPGQSLVSDGFIGHSQEAFQKFLGLFNDVNEFELTVRKA